MAMTGGKKDNVAQLFFQEKGYYPKMDHLNDSGKSKKGKNVIIQQVEAPKVDYDQVIRENEQIQALESKIEQLEEFKETQIQTL